MISGIIYNWVYMAYREYNYHLGYIAGCLGYIEDETLPSYVGIVVSDCKDPY